MTTTPSPAAEYVKQRIAEEAVRNIGTAIQQVAENIDELKDETPH